MTIRIGEAVMLLIIPVILSIMLVFFKTLPDRLIAWYCAGLLMSQWLHVMLFISFDKINNPNKTTVLKIAYFFEKKWWVIFVLGVAVCTFTAIGLYIITKGGNDIHIKHITLMVLLSVFLSQLCGSSIPKFGFFRNLMG
jgi:hypothetical protein